MPKVQYSKNIGHIGTHKLYTSPSFLAIFLIPKHSAVLTLIANSWICAIELPHGQILRLLPLITEPSPVGICATGKNSIYLKQRRVCVYATHAYISIYIYVYIIIVAD